MKKAVALILVILALVLTSGCLREQSQCPLVVSQTDGLNIDRFQPSYDLVPVGSVVKVQMDVTNIGASTAKDIKARLWSHGGFEVTGNELIPLDDPLSPSDLSICSAGDSTTVSWTLRAGCDPREVTLSAYLDYNYTSEGYAEMLLAAEEEAERVRGEFLKSEEGQNVPGAGPIQLQIEPLQTQPVIITNNSANFDVRLMLKNTGDGMVGQDGNGNIRKLELYLQGPCTFMDDEGLDMGSTNTITGVQLREGEQEALEILHLNYTGDANFIKDVCSINADADYQYRLIVATDGKVGITGSEGQIEICQMQQFGSTRGTRSVEDGQEPEEEEISGNYYCRWGREISGFNWVPESDSRYIHNYTESYCKDVRDKDCSELCSGGTWHPEDEDNRCECP